MKIIRFFKEILEDISKGSLYVNNKRSPSKRKLSKEAYIDSKYESFGETTRTTSRDSRYESFGETSKW